MLKAFDERNHKTESVNLH